MLWQRNGRHAVVMRIIMTLGSLKLAVPVMAVLACVIAVATVLEADYGREYAQWYVYHSRWFIALLAMLGVNIFAAAITRWPWKRHQTGFVVTHCGLLILLSGSIQTFISGVEGQVTLAEGQSTTKMILPQQSQITASWINETDEPPFEFCFVGGPRDWNESTSLDVGELDGVGARIVRYYRSARAKEDWIHDESHSGGPVVRLKVQGPSNTGSAEQVLVDQAFGDETYFGPIRLRLQRARASAMLEDFLNATSDDLGEKGVLVAYYQHQAHYISVNDKIGKRVPIGEHGAAVEIVEYLPNAKPDAHGRFKSPSEQPLNPLLELRVHVPGEPNAIRQLAFAKNPLLNLDPIYGRVCPVQFDYRHPNVQASSGVEFMQTADAKLYCRVVAANHIFPQGEVKPGARIEVPGKFSVFVLDHLPHARQQITFEPVSETEREKNNAQAAAEITMSVDGVTQTVWLQRGHPIYGTRTLVWPQGSMRIRFDHAEAPLGCVLTLIDFHRDRNPGGVGNATFSSSVRIVDRHAEIDAERDISMNNPLDYSGLTFYQSAFNETDDGLESSTFSVVRDPGRTLKYAGSLMICVGIAIMFYMRAYFFKHVPRRTTPNMKWIRRLARWRSRRSPLTTAAVQN